MGKTSAELELEIRHQRHRIELRVDALSERMRGELEEATGTLSDTVLERTKINDFAETRPLTATLGAFGVGVALGIASDRGGGRKKRSRRSGRGKGRQRDRGGGLLDELTGAFSGLIGDGIQDEVRKFLDPLLRDDQRRASGQPPRGDQHEDGAYAEGTAASRRSAATGERRVA